MGKDFLSDLEELLDREQILTEELMSRHTTFRVGGPAEFYLQPRADQIGGIFSICHRYGMPYMIIGNGSNLLVGDKGIRSVVIEIGKKMDFVRVEGEKILVSAGSLLSRAAKEAAVHGLTGMEFAAGIQGCMGGAVVMNAGAYGGEMKDIIQSVTILTPEGQQRQVRVEDLDLSYRHSCVQEKGWTVLFVTLKLQEGCKQEIMDRMKELTQQRMEKQPLEYPSAGSTFKRPEGNYAGKLIMEAGLKGYQIGGAQVAEKHCGFIINRGEATAADIIQLIQKVQTEVKNQFSIELEPEIKLTGEF
ncbi:MAG: UDP-N-acetylmuramate dehydrogenase [Lachnospiraceae bacterium]